MKTVGNTGKMFGKYFPDITLLAKLYQTNMSKHLLTWQMGNTSFSKEILYCFPSFKIISKISYFPNPNVLFCNSFIGVKLSYILEILEYPLVLVCDLGDMRETTCEWYHSRNTDSDYHY